MSRVFGVILAGGGGTRLGGLRKADIRIGGMRLVDRVIYALAGRVDELAIASGQLTLRHLPREVKIINDAGGKGPLLGMEAATKALPAASDDILVFAAVDTPFLSHDYVPRLVSAAGQFGAAYAAWGEAFYPTNSAWQFGTLTSAIAAHAPNVGPKTLLQSVGAVRIDWSEDVNENPFVNLNTPADLVALQRRALTSREKPGTPSA